MFSQERQQRNGAGWLMAKREKPGQWVNPTPLPTWARSADARRARQFRRMAEWPLAIDTETGERVSRPPRNAGCRICDAPTWEPNGDVCWACWSS
jgi:hypothetical protein